MPTVAGLPACRCQAAWFPIFVLVLIDHGQITTANQLRVFQLIGGYVKSGGTHIGGGAADFWIYGLSEREAREVVHLARQMGADATWHRTAAQGFTVHIHSCLRGCPHGTPHYGYQMTAVDRGQNGLVGGRPDDGPRPLSHRTWTQGIAWAQTTILTKGPLMALTDRQQADLHRWAKESVELNRETVRGIRQLKRILPGSSGNGAKGDLWDRLWNGITGRTPQPVQVDTAAIAAALAKTLGPELSKSVASELSKRLAS